MISGARDDRWAWFASDVWALMLTPRVSPAVIRRVGVHLLAAGERDRIAWEPSAVRELLMFGHWVWIASILTFRRRNRPAILGSNSSYRMLGFVYSIATMISGATRTGAGYQSHVIFPLPAYSNRANFRAPIFA